tara:strand:- start:74 stop:709 length:636 start_codon:yes stop_codon:yes gene_type:complete
MRVRPHPDDPGILIIDGKEYARANKRVRAFRTDHPIQSGWEIRTTLLQHDEQVVHWRAEIVNPEGRTIANGDKLVRNTKSALEACQTGAIARALFFAGYADGEVASAEDMVEFLQSSPEPNDQHLHRQSFRQPAAGKPTGIESEWQTLPPSEVEKFFAVAGDLGLLADNHRQICARLKRPAPWEMDSEQRDKYAAWLTSPKGGAAIQAVLG